MVAFHDRIVHHERYRRNLTRRISRSIIFPMRRTRPFHATALGLLALMGALSTGLPSHHHRDSGPADADLRLVSADHHSHGTQLVEQDERAPSNTLQMVTGIASDVDFAAPAALSVTPTPTRVIRPTERAPPPGAPRAPPLLG
jgi:hypothetical protein